MYTIVGIQEMNFTTDDGTHIDGFKVHFTYDFPLGSEYQGQATDTVFVRRNMMDSRVKVGANLMPCCNSKGRFQCFVDCNDMQFEL